MTDDNGDKTPDSCLGQPATTAFQRTATIGDGQAIFPGVIHPSQKSTFHGHLETVKNTMRDDIIELLQRHGGALVLREHWPLFSP
jgi:hypothetical protein